MPFRRLEYPGGPARGLSTAAQQTEGTLEVVHRLPLHEITTHAPSLEEAFMQLTADSVDYQAGGSR